MPTAQKEKAIEQAKKWYDKSVGLVFTDYRGLKVKELQQLRRSLSAKGAEIHVIKNTLFRLAAGDGAAQFPAELHNGPTAIAFVYENESEVAKVLFDFEKQTKTLSVKGGYFGGQVFDAKGMEALSKLPPRDVLIAQVIGTIAAPLTNLVSVIEALYADPIRTIGAVSDKMNEGAPPAEAKAEEPKSETAPLAEAAPAEAPAETSEATSSPAEAEDAPAQEAAAPEAAPEEATKEGEGESA